MSDGVSAAFEWRTLDALSWDEAANAFNLCYEGYVIPVRAGAADLASRCRAEDVDPSASHVVSDASGPVAIGPGTRIVDSFIGPFSAVGADCLVESSEIEHSVVMDGSQIIEIARLEDSLIGSDAVIQRTKRRPRALRLMVGDHCQVDVE